MPPKFSSVLFRAAFLLLLLGQPGCIPQNNGLVALTGRPNSLRLSQDAVESFLLAHYARETNVRRLKMVRTENAYYLLAEVEAEGCYALELVTKGRRCYLSSDRNIHTCMDPDLSLGTFLQKDGYIRGCRNARHTMLPPVPRRW
ncbi:MAG: hypothetical protein RLY31_2931 [Bacteroidota bacterium]|jgi:hypothetical protein